MSAWNEQTIPTAFQGRTRRTARGGKPSGCPEAASLDELHARSRSGLWGLLLFLGASVVAFYFKSSSLAGLLPAELMAALGPVPPLFMATVTLWISTLSSLAIIAGRLYHGTPPSRTATHVAFRVGFYLLYFALGALDQHIHALFISGLVVLALQHHNVMGYYTRQIEAISEPDTCLQDLR